MDTAPIVTFPRPSGDEDPEPGAGALREIDAAIALVETQMARRVRLTALPFVDHVAAIGLARARAAGMAFAIERGSRAGVVTVTIGPLE